MLAARYKCETILEYNKGVKVKVKAKWRVDASA